MSFSAEWIAKGVLQVNFSGVSVSLATGNNGIGIPNLPDKSIQFFGTFNSALGALQGSNATTPTASNAYFNLSTPSGVNIVGIASTVGPLQVLENCRWYRIAVSGATGGGGTSITAQMICYANPR